MIDSQILHTTEVKLTGLYLPGLDFLPFLKIGETIGLHSKILFEVQDSIYYPLYLFFNKSIEEGKVPAEWKKAIVSPIFKKGKKSSPGKYRPVSLISIMCKICESIIRDKIMNYMSNNDLFTNSQYGFRPGRSCVTQLLEVLDDWSELICLF
jgi:hypothetical protein